MGRVIMETATKWKEATKSPSTMRVVLGIDPGVSTGVAIAIESVECGTNYWHYISFTSTREDMWEMIKSPVTQVVVEEFNAQLISKYGLHTVEAVGGVMALCARENIPVVRDTPQQRNPYIDKARTLVKNGYLHANRHEVDAMSHVLFWLYHNVPGLITL